MDEKWEKLNNLIQNSSQIILSTHMNPDPDGLGSEIAFYYYLKYINKDCKIINISPIETNYKILDPDDVIECYKFENHANWVKKCDLAIVFDIGDYRRLGTIADHINDKNISVNRIIIVESNEKIETINKKEVLYNLKKSVIKTHFIT